MNYPLTTNHVAPPKRFQSITIVFIGFLTFRGTTVSASIHFRPPQLNYRKLYIIVAMILKVSLCDNGATNRDQHPLMDWRTRQRNDHHRFFFFQNDHISKLYCNAFFFVSLHIKLRCLRDFTSHSVPDNAGCAGSLISQSWVNKKPGSTLHLPPL